MELMAHFKPIFIAWIRSKFQDQIYRFVTCIVIRWRNNEKKSNFFLFFIFFKQKNYHTNRLSYFGGVICRFFFQFPFLFIEINAWGIYINGLLCENKYYAKTEFQSLFTNYQKFLKNGFCMPYNFLEDKFFKKRF